MSHHGDNPDVLDVLNAGILAIEFYIPLLYVSEKQLELQDGVAGKYTQGLGLSNLACCSPCEDAISMALTVVRSLLKSYDIGTEEVGKLVVSSESHLDRSKSISSHLRSLFPDNDSIEGVDMVHACYGMTSALLSTLDWVQSPHWDHRYSLVVGSDIAIYPPGNEWKSARATGGCGAVAVLVGRDAPIVVDRKLLVVHSVDSNEFSRPMGAGPFPVFDGQESTSQFFRALDRCYGQLFSKAKSKSSSKESFLEHGLQDVCFFISHAPYPKIVEKAFARLKYHDHLRVTSKKGQESCCKGALAHMEGHLLDKAEANQGSFLTKDLLNKDKNLEKMIIEGAKNELEHKVQPGLLISEECGNMYTASLYAGLGSLIHAKGSKLEGCRILTFAFGSGSMAAMFVIHGRRPATCPFTLETISSKLNLKERLQKRQQVSPSDFVSIMNCHETDFGRADFKPCTKFFKSAPGIFYLQQVDARYQRFYSMAV